MNGAELITAERQRQIEDEGWAPGHDDQHENGELAIAAACYALHETGPLERIRVFGDVPKIWPWRLRWWKPKDRLRNLVRAGALIAAEIDRLQRQNSMGERE